MSKLKKILDYVYFPRGSNVKISVEKRATFLQKIG